MKIKKLFSLIVLLSIVVSVSAVSKKNSYAGEWKLDREKTVSGNSRLMLSKITFNLKNDSLFTARVYENANGEEYPFTENLTMDGKEHEIRIYDMPRKARAYWSQQDGLLIIETTTTFLRDSVGVDVVSKETWKVNETGSILVADYVSTTTEGEVKGTVFFKK